MHLIKSNCDLVIQSIENAYEHHSQEILTFSKTIESNFSWLMFFDNYHHFGQSIFYICSSVPLPFNLRVFMYPCIPVTMRLTIF